MWLSKAWLQSIYVGVNSHEKTNCKKRGMENSYIFLLHWNLSHVTKVDNKKGSGDILVCFRGVKHHGLHWVVRCMVSQYRCRHEQIVCKKGGGWKIHVLFTTVKFVTCPVSGLLKGTGVCWYATGVLNIMVIEYMVSTYIYVKTGKNWLWKKGGGQINFIYFTTVKFIHASTYSLSKWVNFCCSKSICI